MHRLLVAVASLVGERELLFEMHGLLIAVASLQTMGSRAGGGGVNGCSIWAQ